MENNKKRAIAVYSSFLLAVFALCFVFVTQLSKASNPNSFLALAQESSETESTPAGVCGSAQGGTFQPGDTAQSVNWNNLTFCDVGKPNPAAVSFPPVGKIVSWTCSGNPVAKCSAEHFSTQTPNDPEPKNPRPTVGLSAEKVGKSTYWGLSMQGSW